MHSSVQPEIMISDHFIRFTVYEFNDQYNGFAIQLCFGI